MTVAAAFPIPAAALENHTAILGKTGSGKTSTAKLLVEHLVEAGDRVCILDPVKSDHWGLISSGDGRAPGLPFQILGGPRGHVPLHSGAGAAIGELVATGALPLSIVDMAEFEAGGLQRFFIAFAEALMKKARGVVYLVIEEAHEFAPKERAGLGAENLAIHWAKKLATAGRSKGIRLIFATQRTQALHNACLSSCETMIAHRLTAPADQAPVLAWLKANAEKTIAADVAASLANLKTGTAWLCSGEAQIFEKIALPKFRTYDNSKTPTRRKGGADDVKVAAADVDIDALRALIGDAVTEADANDPAKLKAEIKRMKADAARIAAMPTPAPDEALLDAAHAEGFSKGRIAGAAEAGRSLAHALDAAGELIAAVTALKGASVATIGEAIEAAREGALALQERLRAGPAGDNGPTVDLARLRAPARISPTAHAISRSAPSPSASPARAPALPAAFGTPSGAIGAERRPLQVLVNRAPAGFTEAQWATLTGMKRTGGTWANYKSKLRTSGLVEERGGLWFATDAALAALESVPEGDPIERWKSALGGGPARIIDLFVERPAGAVIERNEIARHVNLEATGGTFSNYLSKLRSNGVIEKIGDGFRMDEALRASR